MTYGDPLATDAGHLSRFTCDAVAAKGNTRRTIDCDPMIERRLALIEKRLDLVPESTTQDETTTAGGLELLAPGKPDDATGPSYRGSNKTGTILAGRNSVASAVDLGKTHWDGKPPTLTALTQTPSQGGDPKTQRQMRDAWVRQDTATKGQIQAISKKWHKV